MTDQTPTQNEKRGSALPIPSQYPLIVAFIGFLLVIGVVFTQTTFNVIGFAGLALIVIGLLAWALLAPDQVRAALTGRTVRFGGTSFVVTIIFLTALVFVYIFIRDRDIRIDLTERDTFSLNQESERVIGNLAADPSVPSVNLIAFYGTSQAGRRDQDTVLFDDYVRASDGKISYEFVDPDRNPIQAGQYGASDGQIVVVALDEAGAPDTENAEVVDFFSQEELTNAILRVAASGDFRAYFLITDPQVTMSNFSTLETNLTDRFDWQTQEISFVDLLSASQAEAETTETPSESAPEATAVPTEEATPEVAPGLDPGAPTTEDTEPEIRLNDPAADGEVLVLIGGTGDLTDEQAQVIIDYLEAGGSLVIFAGVSVDQSQNLGRQVALSENLATYLYDNFGLRYNEDLVMESNPNLSLQSVFAPVIIDLDANNDITGPFAPAPGGQVQNVLVFDIPHSIQVAPEAPQGVTLYELARSSATSYSKSDMDAVAAGNVAQALGDPAGPFVVAAAAENMTTGAHVTLFGSTFLATDDLAAGQSMGIVNLNVAFNSLVWSTNFGDFYQQVTILPVERPQDTPIFADNQTMFNINFITTLVIPFGILGIGILVWWYNHQQAH